MNSKTERLGADFTQGNIPRVLLLFLAPFLLASILNSIYNMVDMVIVGRVMGSSGTVAVSMGGRMLTLFTNANTALAGGGQILIAQQLGAGEKQRVNTSVGTLFTLLLMMSCVMCTFCLIASETILNWLNTPIESFSQARIYLCITSAGLPLISGYNAVCSVLRGMGDSRRPLLFIAVATGANLVLDLLFICVFSLGAGGAALATVISQGMAFALSIRILYRERERFGFDFKLRSFLLDGSSAHTILGIGIPNAAHGFIISVTQLFLVGYVNAFGLAAAAAWSVGDKIISFTNIMSTSVRQAGGAIVAQNIGAQEYDRVKALVRSAVVLTTGFACVLSAVCLLFPQVLFGLFTRDAAVLAYSRSFMAIASLTFLVSALSAGFACVTIGSGNAKLMFAAGILDGLVLRLAFSFWLGIQWEMGVTGFFLANSLARLAPLMFHSCYYFSGAWKRRGRLMK